MANLLDLLRACIESFFTAKKSWIGRQALPAESAVNYDLGTPSPITSPCDGYFVIGTTRATDLQAHVNIWSGSQDLKATSYGNNGMDARAFIACRKGQAIYFDKLGTIDVLCFVKSGSEVSN